MTSRTRSRYPPKVPRIVSCSCAPFSYILCSTKVHATIAVHTAYNCNPKGKYGQTCRLIRDALRHCSCTACSESGLIRRVADRVLPTPDTSYVAIEELGRGIAAHCLSSQMKERLIWLLSCAEPEVAIEGFLVHYDFCPIQMKRLFGSFHAPNLAPSLRRA
jgi:hypothetical protein